MAQTDKTGGGWSLGTTVALAAVLFIVLRLLAISHYDWRTAFALCDTLDLNDIAGVVIGSILGAPAVMAGLLAVLLPVVVAAHLRQFHQGQRRLGRLLLMVVTGALLVAGIITFRLVWALVVLVVTTGVLLLLLRRRDRVQRFLADDVLSRFGLVALVAVTLAAGITDEVWVPRERISVGDTVIVGYVMDDSGQFLKVLQAHDRRVVIVLARDVTSRVDAG